MKELLLVSVFAALLFGYMHWLDYGCEIGGALTAHGKVCIENLK